MTTQISAAEHNTLIVTDHALVIDTRDPQAYAEGHVPGAVNLREIFTKPSATGPIFKAPDAVKVECATAG